MGNTGPVPSPYNIEIHSPLQNQPLQGVFGDAEQPVISPDRQEVRVTGASQSMLAVLINILLEIGCSIHSNCQFPSQTVLRHVYRKLLEAVDTVAEMLEPDQEPDRSRHDDNSKYRCLLCPDKKSFINKGTFTRHITSMHYPIKWYFCPRECSQAPGQGCFARKDKHRLHVKNKHGMPPLSKEELERWTVPVSLPPSCELCKKPVSTWFELIECLCKHCLIPDGNGNQDHGSGGDDGDGDDGDDDNGDSGDNGNNINGGPYNHSPGSGYFGYPNSPGYDHFNGGQSGFYQFPGAAPGMNTYSDQARSPTVSPESTLTEMDKVALGLQVHLKYLQSLRQPNLDHSETCPDRDARVSDSFRTELCFRFRSSAWSHRLVTRTDGSKQNLGQKQLSEKEMLFHGGVIRELEQLMYFENRIFENQVQGSLLTYASESVVVHQLAISTAHGKLVHPDSRIVANLRISDIVYRQVEVDSDKPPEVPSDHIFYLTKEENHESSETAFEATRRATKTRVHLKVRIRAIAGILALRASVSKTSMVVDNNEIGDRWEFGIPVSPQPTQEEAVKIFVWLVQILVFFLRMYPSPKVYVMLESGSFDIPGVNCLRYAGSLE
ncbi:putative C2H2 zinc finger domain protein [Aspergillus stella-maris]|uniref:putative C2H2 zinc finger domain protein n=1 Tax=Aspergillus stella-maris TaxID=1810926 RepID=UPI003CCD8360